MLHAVHVYFPYPPGAGVYVIDGDSTNVPAGTLTNNGIIVALSSGTLYFQCRSGSTVANASQSQFIGLDGNALSTGSNGGLDVQINGDGHPSRIDVTSTSSALSAGEEGVYTCHMRDESEAMVEVNMGIYKNGFNSECLLYTQSFTLYMHVYACIS